MQRLLINRIPIFFKYTSPLLLVAKISDRFVLNKNKARWLRDNLSGSDKDKFIEWMEAHEVDESQLIATEFVQELPTDDEAQDCYWAELTDQSAKPFRKEIFKQELALHLQGKGFFIDPARMALDFSAFEKIGVFDDEYDQYRRIDFLWNPKRDELSFNFGSEKTLVTKTAASLEGGQVVFDVDDRLVYKTSEGAVGKTRPPAHIIKDRSGSPQKFSYKNRYNKLKEFAAAELYDFDSPCFSIDKTGLKSIDPDDHYNVYSQQNLMAFGNENTAINPVIGMREFGPLKKAENAEKKRLLFIYQNRNDANTLYRYLKNGLKHFPGLLSYVGIPVALAEPHKGLAYVDPVTLPDSLNEFLEQNYPGELYPDTLAIVIGPFKRYESDEKESDSYYRIKRILLDKGIASQFVSSETLNGYGVHYSLPNIAIAILAKLGGIPWKLSNKRKTELVVGFNTKRAKESRDQYIGSAVFFDNEGKLGSVKALPISDKTAVIEHLKAAITEYMNREGEPDRLVIHYYKPARRDEIRNVLKLLEGMDLAIPVAVVEVNDSKSKLDICFDAEFNMGMPESGVYVKVGYSEYLLFNNNRYKKNPPRKIDDELPIKLKLSYVNTGGFNAHELIAQVYEFSRLNWKGLKQRSVPVTTTYSKSIAEFSSHFDGQVPQNDIAIGTPWFI